MDNFIQMAIFCPTQTSRLFLWLGGYGKGLLCYSKDRYKTCKTVNNKVSRTMVKFLTHGRLTLLRLMTIN